MEKKEIEELLNRYQTGQCTEEELAWIETVYNKIQKNTNIGLTDDIIKKDLYDIYKTLPQPQKSKTIYLWQRVAASAILVLSVSVGIYFYTKKPDSANNLVQTSAKGNQNNFAPGINKTFLTLANGSKIYLEAAPIGKITDQEGMRITKIKEGIISYTPIPNHNNPANTKSINIITTSKGGQYQVILPDGSHVWLNALSSLKFLTSFTEKKRGVELKGEGYFEIAKNKSRPFKVLTQYQEVEVLGTHFNINSYEDEPTTATTLLEGSVRISQLKSRKSALLKPGQQSNLKDYGIIQVDDVKTDNVIAWKNGLFQFQNSDIKNVIRQLARWYDIDFEFKGPIPNIKLWGEIHRNTDALKALEILSYFDLKYTIVNAQNRKKIIITK
nr:FecR family protein [Pedobacter panaciterrae]